MIREDKFVKVYACGVSSPNETYYSFTVYPGSERPQGCFEPVKIGELSIKLNQQQEYEFTLVSGTEWDFDEKYHDMIYKNLRTVYLFATNINKCLKELFKYDIPELAFLAGKLQYKPAERILINWEKSGATTLLLSIISDYYNSLGVPNLPQADYLLQIVDNPMVMHQKIALTSIMPVVELPTKLLNFTVTNPEPFTSFDPIREKLWWLINQPEEISEQTFNKKIAKKSKDFTYRGNQLIYTKNLNSIEDIPFVLWSYLKKRYNILPRSYDNESFEVLQTLNSIKEGIEL